MHTISPAGLPPKQGLYDPQFEHDACGVGFVVNIKGKQTNEIVRQALTVLKNLIHRGAVGAGLGPHPGRCGQSQGGCSPKGH